MNGNTQKTHNGRADLRNAFSTIKFMVLYLKLRTNGSQDIEMIVTNKYFLLMCTNSLMTQEKDDTMVIYGFISVGFSIGVSLSSHFFSLAVNILTFTLPKER